MFKMSPKFDSLEVEIRFSALWKIGVGLVVTFIKALSLFLSLVDADR